MKLPQITHLQFHVLDALVSGPKKGRELRESLAKAGYSKSLAAFYQLMARLEDDKLVKGTYRKRNIDGTLATEAEYRVLKSGERARQQSLEYYVERALEQGLAAPIRFI